ncbi:MAG: hypothetical protein NC911_08700 [Candidatus Omnitrophica bacterium]|nr:hypothetical protein [Candidatus Omnitrophota bacterium]
MKNKILLGLFFIFCAIILANLFFAKRINGQSNRLVGGPCEYNKIDGSCQIISITKTAESIHQATIGGGPGYEGYEIKFKFSPSSFAQDEGSLSRDALNKEHTLTLANSWYPGEKFLEKYQIREGAFFDCKICIIAKGACTPVAFEFPDINTSDYFETYE